VTYVYDNKEWEGKKKNKNKGKMNKKVVDDKELPE
jgi:hypothetical protein